MSTSTPTHRARVSCCVDLVHVAIDRNALSVWLAEDDRSGWRLPSEHWTGDPALATAADRLSRSVFGRTPLWREQVQASDHGQHPDGCALSIVFMAAMEAQAAKDLDGAWHAHAKLPARLSSRHRAAVAAAIAHIRQRVDQAPVAFHLLPSVFTLAALQHAYEVLLARRLHKASFRRALHAAHLVETADEWRTAGRGRPAELFRFAPRHRRGALRALRLEGVAHP